MARTIIIRILTILLVFSILFIQTPYSDWPASAAPAAGVTQRVSLSTTGVQANAWSNFPSISADGRFVAFHSEASNLVSGDTNGVSDVFVHDRQSGATERVSVTSSGEEGNNASGWPSISADGRFVAFESTARNLVSGDTNLEWDIFVHDRQTGVTERVSISTSGDQGNGDSHLPSISADGRFVAFVSDASNLVSGDTNGVKDIFVRDRQTGETERVSVSSGDVQGNDVSIKGTISADGRFVAFVSQATNLVSGDTNGKWDVFVHDRQTGETERVSVSSSGEQGNDASWEPSISADGRFVAFRSLATNLVSGDTNGVADVFVHDRQTGVTQRVSVSSNGAQSDGLSHSPSISANGRYVAFTSGGTNLVSGDTNLEWDIFVHDRLTGATALVSSSLSGEQANGLSGYPSISSDGGLVAFMSAASNLVGGDTNSAYDIFVNDRCPDGMCVDGGNYPIFLPILAR